MTLNAGYALASRTGDGANEIPETGVSLTILPVVSNPEPEMVKVLAVAPVTGTMLLTTGGVVI
jgi:hypothetical protein